MLNRLSPPGAPERPPFFTRELLGNVWTEKGTGIKCASQHVEVRGRKAGSAASQEFGPVEVGGCSSSTSLCYVAFQLVYVDVLSKYFCCLQIETSGAIWLAQIRSM